MKHSHDIGKLKVKIAKKKLKKLILIQKLKFIILRLNNKNFKKIINNYDYIC